MLPNRISSLMLFMPLLLVGCGSAMKKDRAIEVNTVAPVAVLVERVISGTILNQKLREPAGIAIDQTGSVILVDAGNNRLIKFDEALNPIREIGGYGSAPGLFDQPDFVTVDNGLSLLITDGGNRRLTRFDGRLNFVDELILIDDEDPLMYGIPSGAAITKYGEVWVADRQNNRIALFDNTWQFDRFIGDFGYGGGQLASPEKIIPFLSDQFLVCDAGNSRLLLYDQYGNYERELETDELKYPKSAAIDRLRRVWVLDGENGKLLALSLSGKRLLLVGPTLPGNNEALRGPSDVAFLPDGRMLISDSGNNRLLVCSIVEAKP